MKTLYHKSEDSTTLYRQRKLGKTKRTLRRKKGFPSFFRLFEALPSKSNDLFRQKAKNLSSFVEMICHLCEINEVKFLMTEKFRKIYGNNNKGNISDG